MIKTITRNYVSRTILLMSILMLACVSKHEELCTKGLQMYQQAQYEKAIEAFESYLKSNPDFQKGWLNWNPTFERALTALGNSYYQVKAFSKAIEAYDRSIRIGGNRAYNVPNHFNKGLAQFKLAQYDSARAAFDLVDDRKLNNPKTLIFKSDIYTKQARYDTALFLIDKCIEVSQLKGQALIRKVKLYIEKGMPDSSLSHYKAMLGMVHDSTFALFTEELGIMETYFAHPPAEGDSVAFYKSEALEKIVEGDFNSAEKRLAQALKFGADDIDIHNQLGDVNMAQGKVDQAIAAYQKALASDRLAVNSMWKLANATLKKGEMEHARQLYLKIRVLQPDNLFANVALRLHFEE
ncbi:tetratricopeptide repeat protein [candidate division KSB1 bacterium]|nr:tetratricopeptide repeat protein [candidate division KSB1 bacterium]